MSEIQKRHRWLILTITVLCPFMATIDSSIINVALPVLADKLHVDSSRIAWITAIYLLGQVATLLFFGRLGDIKGLSRVFQCGVALFTAGSFLCSLSSSFSMLLVARVVQALGASATLSNTHAIITRTFDGKERGRALGINGSLVALGYLIGPSLGGFILSVADWHFMFWINVPFGIAVLASGLHFLPKGHGSGGKLDWTGNLLFAVAMLSFFIALQAVGSRSWENGWVLLLFVVSTCALFAFIVRQQHTDIPLVDLSIFKNKWFTISLFCAFASYVAISAYNLLMPFYLEDVRHLSPFVAGLFMSIYPLIVMLLSPMSGILSDRIGTERLTFIGLLFYAAGLLLLATLDTDTFMLAIACFLLLMSVGNGLFQSPNNIIVMSSLPREHLGIGGSLNALARTVGQSTGIAITNAILYAGMSLRLGRTVIDFAEGDEHAFLFGMHGAYITAVLICLLGLAATAARLYFQKRK